MSESQRGRERCREEIRGGNLGRRGARNCVRTIARIGCWGERGGGGRRWSAASARRRRRRQPRLRSLRVSASIPTERSLRPEAASAGAGGMWSEH